MDSSNKPVLKQRGYIILLQGTKLAFGQIQTQSVERDNFAKTRWFYLPVHGSLDQREILSPKHNCYAAGKWTLDA